MINLQFSDAQHGGGRGVDMDHFRPLALQRIHDCLKYTAVRVGSSDDDDFVHYITSRWQKEGAV